LSLTLVALSGSDPTRQVLPLNPELWNPMTIMGPISDIVSISHDV
jgi:hypothetical protein